MIVRKEISDKSCNRTPEVRQKRLKGRRDYAKTNRYPKKYGISFAQFQKLVEDAGHKCQLCSVAFRDVSGPRGPHLDHCHVTGKIRGILCGPCNRAPGFIEKLKTAELFHEALVYLDTSEAKL